MNTERQPYRHAAYCLPHGEIERCLTRARTDLQQARCQLHQTQQAVADAEVDLIARKLEREAAIVRVAELAESIESLQREMERGDGAVDATDTSATCTARTSPARDLAGTPRRTAESI